MGTVMQGRCVKCGYQTKILVGGGLRDCDAQTALSAAPEDRGLAAALKAGGRFRIERLPAVCTHCHKLLAPARVTYWTRSGLEYTVPARCPTCGQALEPAEGPPPCPMCEEPLEMLAVGHWD